MTDDFFNEYAPYSTYQDMWVVGLSSGLITMSVYAIITRVVRLREKDLQVLMFSLMMISNVFLIFAAVLNRHFYDLYSREAI